DTACAAPIPLWSSKGGLSYRQYLVVGVDGTAADPADAESPVADDPLELWQTACSVSMGDIHGDNPALAGGLHRRLSRLREPGTLGGALGGVNPARVHVGGVVYGAHFAPRLTGRPSWRRSLVTWAFWAASWRARRSISSRACWSFSLRSRRLSLI